MTEHAERFTGKAAEYARYRERYDAAIVLRFLREWCGLEPDWLIADVGAGTGMAGDVFRVNGNPVIAVEPNAEMREICASLRADDALFTVIDGSAESTGLASGSVDMIAVGRALHWFQMDGAVQEFRRVLKPGGWVVVLACGRTEDGREENIAYKKLMQSTTSRDSFRDPILDVYRRLATLFSDEKFHHGEADAEMVLDWEGLRGLTLSLSHSPMPGSAAFPAFEAELQRYFDRFEKNGRIRLTSRTWVNAGRLAE